jgi:hypothetical protein
MPTLSPRRLAAAAALAGAVALSPVAVAAASPGARTVSGPGAATPKCATSGLVVWLDTEGNGAAGSTFYNLNLTNLSGHACTLRGYPGVSAVNLTGGQVGRAASRSPVVPPASIRLARGATATVILRIVDALNFTPSACGPVTAAGLRVYPPGRTASKVVPFPFLACSHPGPVFLSVEAVQKG